MKRETCETCKAFDVLGNTCRVKAPVAMPVPQVDGSLKVMGIFPYTTKTGWCAEHVPEVH